MSSRIEFEFRIEDGLGDLAFPAMLHDGLYRIIVELIGAGLKRCPFCGGEAELLDGSEITGIDPGFWVSCTQCGTEGPEYGPGGREYAIRSWNRRDGCA